MDSSYVSRMVNLTTLASTPRGRTEALIRHAKQFFGEMSFESCQTRSGIVALRCDYYRPMIFKNTGYMAQGRPNTFLAGFGAPLSEAIIASCSAYPFFEKFVVHTTKEGDVEVIDGGFVANDPTLFALTDAVRVLGKSPDATTVLSIGTRDFPGTGTRFLEALAKTPRCPYFRH